MSPTTQDINDQPSDQRYARAEYLSRFIPELDPRDGRAKTTRVKMARRSVTLLLQMGIALLVVTVSFSVTIWVITAYPPDDGIGTFYFGNCSETSTVNTCVHMVLNILSSLFLGAGSYCMQILIAPSRNEIDVAHRKGRVMEIGVPSIKNFRYIDRRRSAAWLIIGLIATMLHIFWNSTIFTSLPIASIPRAIVTSDFKSAADNWTRSDPLTQSPNWRPPPGLENATVTLPVIYSLQEEAVNFTSLDKRACIKNIIDPMESTNSVVVVAKNFTTAMNNGSSLLDGWINSWDQQKGGWTWSNAWICIAHQTGPWKFCTWDFAQTFVDNWTLSSVPVQVDYCLVGEGADNNERCGLHYSAHVLGIVCLCALLESLVICWTWLQYRRNGGGTRDKRTMVTMGDAIHTFLETPGQETDETGEHEIKPGSIVVREARWEVQPQVAWAKAVSVRAWTIALLLFLAGAGICLISIVNSVSHLKVVGLDPNKIWQQGFQVIPVMTASDLGPLTSTIKNSRTAAMLCNILLANSPQVLVSFLYLFYNNILTRQLVADELLGFLREDGKKVLRVSSPEGMQRSTYFLSLPLKYSASLMVVSIVLHWLISQSIFLVQSCSFSPGKRNKRLPLFDHSTRGYSVLASTLSVILAVTMVFVLVLHSAFRKYHNIPTGFQLMAFNSRALEAICQRPEADTDARYFPIRIGPVPRKDTAPRLSFSTDIDLKMPEDGVRYLQPVFVRGSSPSMLIRFGRWLKTCWAALKTKSEQV